MAPLPARARWTTGHILLCYFVFIHVTDGVEGATPASIPCYNSSVPCGQQVIQPITQRVVGGHEAVPGSWPWNVILVELGYQVCGAFVLTENYLLSAAHCFEGSSSDPSRWVAVAGRHRLDRFNEGQVVMQISKIIIHEHFNNITIGNDIALLVLAEPLTFSSLVRPLCLPSPSQGVSEGQLCVLAGWGTTQGTGDDRLLNQVTLPVIADSTCSQSDWYGKEFLPNTTFCAGYKDGGKDACTGDSGSPLMCNVDGTWFAQGISSWGFGCAQRNWPGIYTDVSRFIPWIQDAINSDQGPCFVVG